jgi:hypothetical protein
MRRFYRFKRADGIARRAVGSRSVRDTLARLADQGWAQVVVNGSSYRLDDPRARVAITSDLGDIR